MNHNLGNSFRRRRMEEFLRLVEPVIQLSGSLRILDLGGTSDYWRALPSLYRRQGVEIIALNLDSEGVDENIIMEKGDACNTRFQDDSFDVVHSNSVIEHVGDLLEMKNFAVEVRRLAPRYFVQTPNFYFPIEPHFKLPAVHWLPKPLRQLALLASGRVQGLEEAAKHVGRIRLLRPREMRELFPDADLWCERFAGMTKSIVAIKGR